MHWTILRSAILGLALGLSGAASAQDLPAAVAAPGYTTVLSVHAEGAQVYDCVAGADGKLGWKFREPIASLLLDGKTVGRHYAGPHWEHVDGSIVAAKVVGNAPGASANDIALLKLEVTKHDGKKGILSDVALVQRIKTHGGVAKGACDKAGAFHSAPYSTEYVFLRKGS
jgi:hypothetical protein